MVDEEHAIEGNEEQDWIDSILGYPHEPEELNDLNPPL